MKIKYHQIIVTILLVFGFLFSSTALATNTTQSCNFNGGTVCTNISDDLASGATGINPGQTVNLSFSVFKKDTADAPNCQSGTSLFNVVRHYIAGGPDYEYLNPASGTDIEYSFSSGVDQQKNHYGAVFYCWTSSQGTSKPALDTLFGTLNTRGQVWLTPEFNLQTRATTINPNCSQITDCSKYPVRNDCEGNRCNLNPACRWTGSTCVAVSGGGGGTTTQNFELTNPIGVNEFQDLVNIIGKWIFNLAIPIAVIIIIYAGLLMLTAGDNPGRFKKGSDALKYAVIGLAVVLIGKGFVTLIKSILSLKQ